MAGMQADLWAMGNFSVNFMEYWEYIHNIAYMVGNLGEGGRLALATTWGTFLRDDLVVNKSQPLLLWWDPIESRSAARYYFQGLVALPFLYFQYSNWSAAISSLNTIHSLLTTQLDNSTAWLLNYYDGLLQYAQVMQAYDQGDAAAARTSLAKLAELYASLNSTMNIVTENGFQVGQRSYISLGVNLAEANATYYALLKQYNLALPLLAAANVSEGEIPYNEPPVYTRPVLTTYADVLFDLFDATSDTRYLYQAVDIYTQIIHSPWHNNTGFGWYGIGYTYGKLNNVTGANAAFSYFLNVTWKTADQDLPQVRYAKNYINSHPNDEGSSSGTMETACLVMVLVFVMISLI